MSAQWSSRLRADRVLLAAIVIAIVGVGIRLALVWLVIPIPTWTENMRAGFTLAQRGYLGDPFSAPTGPTAHVAPLYPALIAAAVKLSGDMTLGFDLARSIVALAFGAFLGALPLMSRRLGMGGGAGIVAALALVAPSPPVFTWIEVTGQHETALTMVALAFVTTATIAALRTPATLSTGRAAALGAAWGVAAHVSPVVLPPLVALLGVAIVWHAGNPRTVLRLAATVLAALSITVAPWTIRNHAQIGGYFFIRDNFGYELAVSNAPDARADMRDNMTPTGTMSRHPFLNLREAERLRGMGERAYYQRHADSAMRWIRDNPRRFAELTWERIGLFFLPKLGREHHAPFYFSVLTLSLVGLYRLARRERFVATALGLSFLAFAAPHFLVQSSPRYSYPVLWTPLLLAAYALLELRHLVRRDPVPAAGAT